MMDAVTQSQGESAVFADDAKANDVVSGLAVDLGDQTVGLGFEKRIGFLYEALEVFLCPVESVEDSADHAPESGTG